MVNTDIAPALPWGASTQQGNDTPTLNATSTGAILTDPQTHRGPVADANEVRTPSAGSKIEVKWLIEEGEQVEIMWWTAVVEPAEAEQAGVAHTAMLRYQPFRDFEEEVAHVKFLPQGRLYHLDNSAEQLKWRAEGEDFDDSDNEDADGMILNAGDLDQEAQVLERELGVSAEQVMEQQLRSYPIDQQRHLASGYRNFVEHFRENLGRLAQSQGGNYTVTESDVQGILRTLKR